MTNAVSSNSWMFPFGAPLVPAKAAKPAGRVRAFVVGVYSSAVHAKWIGADGKQLCQALAVASEPYSFWDGADAAAQVLAVAKNVPAAMGTLETEKTFKAGFAAGCSWLPDFRRLLCNRTTDGAS